MSTGFINLLRFDKRIVWIFVGYSPLLIVDDQQLYRGDIINKIIILLFVVGEEHTTTAMEDE